MASPKTRRTVFLPASIVDQAEALARSERRSVQVVLSKALKDYAKAQVERPKPRGRKTPTAVDGHAGLLLWEAITGLWRDIPEAELRRLPRDGALNHDRYIYGRP